METLKSYRAFIIQYNKLQKDGNASRIRIDEDKMQLFFERLEDDKRFYAPKPKAVQL